VYIHVLSGSERLHSAVRTGHVPTLPDYTKLINSIRRLRRENAQTQYVYVRVIQWCATTIKTIYVLQKGQLTGKHQ
jgi:hypothetical protein